MVQEQVNDRTVAITVKATKITGRLLAQAMRFFLRKAREPSVKSGKQSIKQLTRQGASLTNVEVSGDNIGLFKKTARKYNVSFSLKRDDSEKPPRWSVFFKSKDGASMDAAFKEFSRSVLRQKGRDNPSMLAELAQYRELTKTAVDPVKHRDRGGHEL
jgi:hypothetical protein